MDNLSSSQSIPRLSGFREMGAKPTAVDKVVDLVWSHASAL
jgi:hypothetical protein